MIALEYFSPLATRQKKLETCTCRAIITSSWLPGMFQQVPLDRGLATASEDKETECQAGFQIAHDLPFFAP